MLTHVVFVKMTFAVQTLLEITKIKRKAAHLCQALVIDHS